MGRGFWSRGPGVTARGQKGDYPTLYPDCQTDGRDYAPVLQAHLDLVQLMANSRLSHLVNLPSILIDQRISLPYLFSSRRFVS